jgi:hypothetical protein
MLRCIIKNGKILPTLLIFSVSIIGVGAQVDSCTAAIFRCFVRPLLLYSASSSVTLAKYSILHSVVSS